MVMTTKRTRAMRRAKSPKEARIFMADGGGEARVPARARTHFQRRWRSRSEWGTGKADFGSGRREKRAA